MIRLLYAIPTWIIYVLFIFVPLVIIGWIMVPIACLFKAYKMTDENLGKPGDGPIYHFTWPIMWIWDNEFDGIANRNYAQYDSLWKQIFYWYNRNPVSNLRLVPYITCKADPKKIKYIGTYGDRVLMYKNTYEAHYALIWQGFYTGLLWQHKTPSGGLRRLFIGYKILPYDTLGISVDSHRFRGTGFAIQWKPIKGE